MRYLIVALMFILSACSQGHESQPAKSESHTKQMVTSYKTLSASRFNTTIDQAVAEGEKWPASPALVAYYILGGDAETRSFHLSREADSAENPSRMTCVVIRDGFLDDSVRGDWHKIMLVREPDNTWRISEIQKAHSCWRSDDDTYRSDPCP